MELPNAKSNICKTLAKNRFDKFDLECRLTVLPRGNSYDKLNIFETHNFLNMILWMCLLKVLALACGNIDIINIFQYIFFMR